MSKTAGDKSAKQLEKFHELLSNALEWECGFTKRRSAILAAQFANLNEFLNFRFDESTVFKSVGGKKLISLNRDQNTAIEKMRQSKILKTQKTVADNYLTITTRRFVKTQIKMLEELTLDELSPNPFLIQCLNLRTPEEVVGLNVYMFATRSIVTSMGFFVEKLLLASSDDAHECEKPWDILKKGPNGKRHWIQIKSGPNDMDADQIRHWTQLISKKIKAGDRAYIGITYGKRASKSVTMGLFKTYLPDWKKRTLIGRELWDFISGDKTYHERIFPILADSASQVLGTESISTRIDQCIARITKEFSAKYKPKTAAIAKYIRDIF